MRKTSSNSGFTLIELMVVISIIGVLVALSSGVITMVRKQNRVTAARATIQKLELALNAYYNDCGLYPPTPEDFRENAEVFGVLTGDITHDGKYDPKGDDLPKNHRTWRGPYLPMDSKNTDTRGNLKDPWSAPYRYRENDREAPKCPSNPSTFLLYSCGPDRRATDGTREEVIDFALEFNRDNVKNWEDE